MYQLLKRLGFDRVMNWPMFESIPAPLSETDAQALRDYRRTIDDAHAAGLEFWLAQTANLTPPPSIAAKPWKERNSYPVWKHVRLDDPAAAAASKQPLIPWVWCGWGTEKVWGGNPNTPPEQIAPFVRASLETLAAGMPEPWQMLPERSNRENWANGRVNVALAEETGLMPRSTLFLYEAIEYEPSIPGSNLQFADIRRMLRDEAKYAATADGVFGNAQQPVMVLPNLYFFARAAADLAYLDTPDEEVLGDLADLLGGPRDLLVPAWRCLQLPLDRLPADLPDRLRKATLTGEAGRFIPGGERQYLDILAAEVESRRGFLEAIATPAGSNDEAAAKSLAASGTLGAEEAAKRLAEVMPTPTSPLR
jgi:hypothetical protein